MIKLKLETEERITMNFRMILSNCNNLLDDNGNEFSFSNLKNGKHLINLVLVKSKKNMILEVDKRNETRLTIKFKNDIEPMGKMNNGDWRIMFRDTKGIRK